MENVQAFASPQTVVWWLDLLDRLGRSLSGLVKIVGALEARRGWLWRCRRIFCSGGWTKVELPQDDACKWRKCCRRSAL